MAADVVCVDNIEPFCVGLTDAWVSLCVTGDVSVKHVYLRSDGAERSLTHAGF